MSSSNAQLNCTNGFIFHHEFGWVLDHSSNPLYGWPMKKVLIGNPYKVPANDLYGRLFFYIVDKMKTFVNCLKTKKLFIHLYDEDARILMPKF